MHEEKLWTIPYYRAMNGEVHSTYIYSFLIIFITVLHPSENNLTLDELSIIYVKGFLTIYLLTRLLFREDPSYILQ